MINENKWLSDRYRVGVITPQILLKMCEVIIMPVLMYAMETWSKFKIKNIDKTRISQGKIIKWIFGLPKSTPTRLLYLANVRPYKQEEINVVL